MRNLICVLALSCFIGTGTAQMRKWSLVECVNYAMDNNLTVEQFELDLENAHLDKIDALGNFLPSLNGTVSASERSGFVLDPVTNSNTSGTILSGSASVTASYTLFDGLQNVHRANRAKMNILANRYRLDDLKDDIRLNVANSYLQVLSNKELLNVARAQYAVTENDVKRTRELVASGVLPQGDLLEIEATAANQQQQIINAEGNVLLARIALAQLLQITDYVNFDIADETFDVPASDILDNTPKVIYDKALSFRNDIKLAETNVDIAEKDLQISRGLFILPFRPSSTTTPSLLINSV